jgi:hypothetical protein
VVAFIGYRNTEFAPILLPAVSHITPGIPVRMLANAALVWSMFGATTVSLLLPAVHKTSRAVPSLLVGKFCVQGSLYYPAGKPSRLFHK